MRVVRHFFVSPSLVNFNSSFFFTVSCFCSFFIDFFFLLLRVCRSFPSEFWPELLQSQWHGIAEAAYLSRSACQGCWTVSWETTTLFFLSLACSLFAGSLRKTGNGQLTRQVLSLSHTNYPPSLFSLFHRFYFFIFRYFCFSVFDKGKMFFFFVFYFEVVYFGIAKVVPLRETSSDDQTHQREIALYPSIDKQSTPQLNVIGR